jgi:tetratricopeptide (TPR) repeat protein
VSNGALGQVLILQSKFDEAIKFCEKSAQLMPDSVTSHVSLADAYFLNGRTDDAIAEVKKGIEKATGYEKWSSMGSLGYYYAKTGHISDAEKIYSQLKTVVDEYPPILNDLTLIAYALNRPDEGFEYFHSSYERRLAQVPINRRSPLWRDIYSDPRIIELVSEPRPVPTPSR